MSHFSVAVLSYHPDEVESLLAPYNEDPSDPEFLELVESSETMEEMRVKYEVEGEADESFADFVSRWYGYTYDEELDQCGYLCNPNAKWDWWMIGGRWSDMLHLKPGCHGNHGERNWCNKDEPHIIGRCDQARLCDINISDDEDAYRAAARFWEVVVEGKPLAEGENPKNFKAFYNPEYYIAQYEDKQTYAQSVAAFSTWALVTPDGEWHEKGKMGWWGFNDATKESRETFRNVLEEALLENPDLWITIVDCHI